MTRILGCLVLAGTSALGLAWTYGLSACSSSSTPVAAGDAGSTVDGASGTPNDTDAGTPSATRDASAPHKRVFVTSKYYPGNNLGGLAKMDSACNSVATAAKLGGTWRAWASSSTENAIERLADVGPWFTLAGGLVAPTRASLADGPEVPIDRDESGARLGGFGNVWTGTTRAGKASGATCSDWAVSDGLAPDGGQLTGTVGLAFATVLTWTDTAAIATCDGSSLSLYCFEQ